ncbi:aminotransferase class I/II-fold pyridoxal phosphate-dependent enzyme [uncultured Clostridium sp.]|uniref:aminotransferase class I/II-fold pyridoxal phosphate-dependent enzyme n=1 Tax=uncultured Clostridium sp. TaxID=59620 RepID=UPI0025F9D81D|nr:aminotransferase class I/II-fold pyridoxal phosphate-dependent enzyme [uncultured Clostridium sp.]
MKIYFSDENIKQYNKYAEEIFKSNFWTEGNMIRSFEEESEEVFGLPSCAVSNGGAGLYLLFQYADVKGKDVIIPSNTFWATARAAKMAGANVIYADCNKEDLCLSFESLKEKITPNTAAVAVVHIGGHIAFEIEKIAKFCKERNIALIEDCAHAHGAEFNGKKPGSWGIGGAYSFYATKTITTGEGGLIVSKDKNLIQWAKTQRNYGKKVIDGKISYSTLDGFDFRISEFTAALGRIELKNLPYILNWKRNLAKKYDQIFENRVKFPEGMKSGYYKYIVFDYNLKESTGKVFQLSDHCDRVEGLNLDLPNSIWVGEHHACPPMYVGWENADKSVEEIAEILIGK